MNVALIAEADYMRELVASGHIRDRVCCEIPLEFPVDLGKLFGELVAHSVQAIHFIAREMTPEHVQLLKRLKRWRDVGIIVTSEEHFKSPLIRSWIGPATTIESVFDAEYSLAGLGELGSMLTKRDLDEDFYDERYFYQGGFRYAAADGTYENTGYCGRSWDGGYGMLVKGVRAMDVIGSVIDVGCDCGGWVDYLVRQGFEAYGVDYSAWALDHPIGAAEGRIKLCDLARADEVPLAGKHSLVTAFDFWEHIYLADIPRVVENLRRFAIDVHCRFLFQVPSCDAPNPCAPYTLTRGELPGLKDEAQVFNYGKGHVTMLHAGDWDRQFRSNGLIPDPESKAAFVEGSPIFGACPNWLPENIYVYR